MLFIENDYLLKEVSGGCCESYSPAYYPAFDVIPHEWYQFFLLWQKMNCVYSSDEVDIQYS